MHSLIALSLRVEDVIGENWYIGENGYTDPIFILELISWSSVHIALPEPRIIYVNFPCVDEQQGPPIVDLFIESCARSMH